MRLQGLSLEIHKVTPSGKTDRSTGVPDGAFGLKFIISALSRKPPTYALNDFQLIEQSIQII